MYLQIDETNICLPLFQLCQAILTILKSITVMHDNVFIHKVKSVICCNRKKLSWLYCINFVCNVCAQLVTSSLFMIKCYILSMYMYDFKWLRKCTKIPTKYAHCFRFKLFLCRFGMDSFTFIVQYTFWRTTLLSKCHITIEITLDCIGKCITWIHDDLQL